MTARPFPGWDVADDEGLLIATRQVKLTRYQREYGALAEVDARDEGELWLLVDAQTRLAERLATAETLNRREHLRVVGPDETAGRRRA